MQVGGVDEVEPAVESEPLVVLVVEDEVLVRLATAECLRNAGFVVIEAVSAEEAQTALEAAPNIDAVLSDINMPDPNDGLGLLVWMQAQFPDVPVILASGHSNPVQAIALSSFPNVTDFVPKPFGCTEIEHLLRKRIASRRQASK